MRTIAQFMKTVASFREKATIFQGLYDELVEESVSLVWAYGDISPVNAIIEATSVLKGFNRRAVVSYYRDVIPFTFDSKLGVFTKKDDNKVKNMGGTLGGGTEDSMGAQVLAHIIAHDWHDQNKEKAAKPYVFNDTRIINGIAAMIRKGLSSGNITHEQLEKLRGGVAGEVDKAHSILKAKVNGTATSLELGSEAAA